MKTEAQMTSIKNNKTALVAISAALVVSIIAVGSGRTLLAAETITITKNLNNAGVNVQTDTTQKQDCLTAGGGSSIGSVGPTAGSASAGAGAQKISPACVATSTDQVSQSGGELSR